MTFVVIFFSREILTNHVHVVVVEFYVLSDNGFHDGIDDSNQHKEEHNEMHVTGANILFLETDLVSISFFSFRFL